MFTSRDQLDLIPEVPFPVSVADRGHGRRLVLVVFVVVDERVVLGELEFLAFG